MMQSILRVSLEEDAYVGFGWSKNAIETAIYNNYCAKWRWLVTEAAERRHQYPPLATYTEVSNCFSIY